MSAIASRTQPCVLFVKTDDHFSQQAIADLGVLGYSGIKVNQIDQVFSVIEEHQPELLIIDRKLAGKSTDSVCLKIRQDGNRTPILLLLDKENLEDRVAV